MSGCLLEIHLLGGFRVVRDGRMLPLPHTRKALILLAYLAMLEGRPVSREKLAGLLWSDRSDAQARGSLRQALSSLKRLYGDAMILADAGGVAIAQGVAVDATHLIAVLDGDDLVRQSDAAILYGGPFLAGHDAPDPAAEDWLYAERERVQRAGLLLVERLADASFSTPAVRPAASQLAQRLLAQDSAAEEAHRALMHLALAEGRTTTALRQYEACCEALHRTLSAKPEARTRELMEQARQASEKSPVAGLASPEPVAAATPRPGPSIVVLPLDNLAGADDAFVDGIVEEITGALARMRGFFVIARQSSYAFKGQSVDVREIGTKLGVRYALEGSVRRAGDHVRITTQLVDAETGVQLWAQRFDGQLRDVFEFQDMIAARVAGALHPSLRAAEIARARKNRPDVLEAYDLVMRAYPHLWAHTESDNAQAIALLESALEADPRYGLATALLAWCHAQQAAYLWSKDPAASHETSLRLARRAALVVEDDATAFAAIGAAETMCSGDLDLAGSFVERALAIDPNHAWGWLRSGWIHYYAGRFDEAIEHFERALALSPLDPFVFNIQIGMGVCHAEKGNLDTAIRLIETGIRARPGMSWAYRTLALVAVMAGDLQKARQAMSVFLRAHPGITVAKMREGVPKSLATRESYWERLRQAGLPER
jgi:TolB-like protein/Tfp pilus assembly protein PilF